MTPEEILTMKRAILQAVFRMIMACVLLSQTASPSPGLQSAPPENKVEGSIVVEGKTYKLAYAYGKISAGPNDKNRPLVLLTFSDKPINRKDIDSGSKLQNKSQANGAVVLSLRIEGNQLFYAEVLFNGVSLRGKGFSDEMIECALQVLNTKVIKGKASTKGTLSTYSGEKLAFTVAFDVPLHKDEWTGAFYTPPPTGLQPGRASGKMIVNGKALDVNYAYAQRAHDFFDDKVMKVELTLTEKPLPENVAALSKINRFVQSGNKHEIKFELDGKPLEENTFRFATFQLNRFDIGTQAALIFSYETDLVRFDARNLEGRFYTLAPQKLAEETYEMNISFNAAVKDNPNAPITATNGKPLPAGGGEPGRAYVENIRSIKATKNYEELYELMGRIASSATGNSLEPPEAIEKELARDPKFSDPAKRKEFKEDLFKMMRSLSGMDGLRITGGFANAGRATLHLKGVDGQFITDTRVNMHLEGGQWKLGVTHNTITEKESPPKKNRGGRPAKPKPRS